MIRSMTGWGAAEGPIGNARVAVEVRSVNHRFFSPSIKLPGSLTRWEGEVREAMRQRVARGHVSLTARVQREGVAASVLDDARLGAYVEQLREIQRRFGLAGAVDLATLLRLPEVFTTAEELEPGDSPAELLAVVERALEALSEMRGEEGARLGVYLRDRLGVIDQALDRIADRAPVRLTEQRDRLRQSVRELTEGLAVDEQRLAQEVAILADRLDVSEEISRFRSHLAAFRETLDGTSGEPVGKRLGFLLQEMLREANTTGSKAADAVMLSEVVVIKEELERLREQVENLE